VQDTVTTGGLNDILNKEMLKIYPNPATNNITIEVPQPAIIDITNIQGQIIKTLKTIGNKTNIDISAFPDGVYVVEMKTEKGIKVNKFMKE
jgi:SUMO ligase MMS21 Smc5/6 complex component